LRIVSPTTQGFVMARVLTGGAGDADDAAAQAAAMSCGLEPITEADK